MIAGLEPAAFGIGGILTAAAVVFFAYTGFEAVANLGEETKRPGRDLPLGLLGTLGVCDRALHRRLPRGRRHGQVHRASTRAPRSPTPFDQVGAGLGRRPGLDRRRRRADLGDPGRPGSDGPDRLRHGPRRPAAAVDRPGPPALRHPVPDDPAHAAVVVRAGRRSCRWPTLADLVSIGTLFAFVLVSVAVPVLRRTRPDLRAPVPGAAAPRCADPRRRSPACT